MNLPQGVQSKELRKIKRWTIEFPIEQCDAMHEWCQHHDYRIMRQGPKLISVGRCDPKTQRWIIEQDLTETD